MDLDKTTFDDVKWAHQFFIDGQAVHETEYFELWEIWDFQYKLYLSEGGQ